MPEKPQSLSLAVLIDADNTSARHVHAIFEEIVKLGEANVRRIYGDFSGTRFASWNKEIQSLAILQNQQRINTTGKNASNIALVIDATDLAQWQARRLLPRQFRQRLHPLGAASGRTGRWSTASANARRRRRSVAPATGSSMLTT